ncbi:MAG: MutS2/Smr-associated SH3 domain-containing protein [Bacteroidota bacterium]
MISFDQQTLNDLEFPIIQSWLKNYALQKTAHDRLEVLVPTSDFVKVKLELEKLNEFVTIKRDGESFPALDFEEIDKEIRLLAIQNSVLELEGFVRIKIASERVNSMLTFFEKREEEFPTLVSLFSDVHFTTEICEAIDAIFTPKGLIKDDASEYLLEIRTKITALKSQINRNFDKEKRKLLKEGLLADTHETFLNERRVLTLLSTHKRKISGSILGSSKTGSLTYIEPQVNVPLNNELELLQDDERKEIFRILRELTKVLAVFLDLIKAYQVVLTEFDFIQAKSKLALELNACLPGIEEETQVEFIQAFHPILWKNNRIQQKITLPQNIKLDKFSRMLVISGPNAGGKSITLKTIGLLQLMLQAGLLVPVHQNSKMCFFQNVLTDIGDNQSIENELSTYSYRLKRMKYFLDVVNKKTLVLLDEFGTGSDPILGGALAEVFFEELYNKKCFGVITTHYGNIKLKADRLRNAINGCMLFNTETLEPLYRFSIGQPGSSFTFEVAQMNGIPLELIEEAKTKVDSHEVNMDQLLSELQREKTYLEQLNKEHIEAQEIAEKARREFLEKKKALELKLLQHADFMEKNSLFINNGKKLKSFIDRYQTKNRKKDANQPLLDEIKKYLTIEKSKIENKNLTEKLKQDIKKPKKVKAGVPQIDQHQQSKIKIGSTVKLIETKQTGTVEEINGNQLTVAFGFLRMKVELERLSFVK